MNDMARYLGALYYHDSGETVAAIDYSDGTYLWGTKNRKGSNWDLNGDLASLVSVITAQFQANPTTFDTIALTLKDAKGNATDLTLKVELTGE